MGISWKGFRGGDYVLDVVGGGTRWPGPGNDDFFLHCNLSDHGLWDRQDY